MSSIFSNIKIDKGIGWENNSKKLVQIVNKTNTYIPANVEINNIYIDALVKEDKSYLFINNCEIEDNRIFGIFLDKGPFITSTIPIFEILINNKNKYDRYRLVVVKEETLISKIYSHKTEYLIHFNHEGFKGGNYL